MTETAPADGGHERRLRRLAERRAAVYAELRRAVADAVADGWSIRRAAAASGLHRQTCARIAAQAGE